jgi:hypothetical protein
MDPILAVILTIIVIIIIFKFVSINISSTNSNNSYSSNSNLQMRSQSPQYFNYANVPQPILSKSDTQIANKLSLNDLTDDYHKQFYLPPY